MKHGQTVTKVSRYRVALALFLPAGLLVVGCPNKNQAPDALSAANGGQPTSEGTTYDPRTEAGKTVDGFLRTYGPGLGDSLLLKLIHDVSEWSITLREIGDRRLVEPLSAVISDTATHSDDVNAGAIYVLRQLWAQSAVPVIRQYLNVRSKPESRLQAAAALAVLGEAEVGVPVLEEYDRQPGPLSEGVVSTTINYAFMDSWLAVELQSPVQESIVSSFFQKICGQASGQTLTNAICYLLQKDEKSRDIALRRAEDVLKTPAASRNDKTIQYGSTRVLLEKFGGERGRALLSKYQ